jgi:hypothetical protein
MTALLVAVTTNEEVSEWEKEGPTFSTERGKGRASLRFWSVPTKRKPKTAA